MNERSTDFELLRNFIRLGDQEAFAKFVRRHVDLVYATAWRKAEDEGAAQEIAQNVFAAVARKAWRFGPDDSLPAWLYKTTLLEAREWLRGELRRRRREQTAAELGTTMKTPDEQSALRALVPLLDEALLSLREKDRTVLLMRFYERLSLRDVGAVLGIGDDAAQKRVAGALEKVVEFFRSRGFRVATVATTTAALQHTAVSAPALVAAAVTQAATQVLPIASGLTLLLARFLALTQWQKILLCVIALSIPAAWQWQRIRAAHTEEISRQQAQTEAVASQANTSRAEAGPPQAESIPTRSRSTDGPAAAASERQSKEYSVHLTGFINTTEAKIAMVEIRHHYFERSNSPPLVVRKVMFEGESFDDRSIKGAYVHFEFVQAGFDALSARFVENGVEFVYEIEDPSALPPDGRNICLPNAGFDEVVDVYAALMGRTVLCHPLVRPLPISAIAEANDRAAAIETLNRILLGKTKTATVLDGDKFAMLVPTNLLTSVSNALERSTYPTATNETIPAGAIILGNAPLQQALAIYGAYIRRRITPSNKPLPQVGISFRNQTPLARAEVIYGFNIVFGWQGLKAELVDQDAFKMVPLAGR